VTESSLRAEVEALVAIGPRPYDGPGGRLAVEHLARRLEELGYRPRRSAFGVRASEVNLLVEIPGARAGPPVEIGAHHDTVPGSPGADDNASGVAALLEIARALRGQVPVRPIRLCLFGREESGMGGSSHHVSTLEGDTDGIFVLEMVGFRTRAAGSQRTPLRIPLLFSPPRTGEFIAVVANARSRALTGAFVRAARRHVPGLPVFGVRWLGGLLAAAARSDHLPYWRARRLGVMVTDTADLRNPHYHRASDTAATLDYQFLRDVTRATLAAALARSAR
jgi:aminopeptidase YwaD